MPEVTPLCSHLRCSSHLSPSKRILWKHLYPIYDVSLSFVVSVTQITVVFEILVVIIQFFLHSVVPLSSEGTSFLENEVSVAHHFCEVALHQRTDLALLVGIADYIVGKVLMKSHSVHILWTIIQFLKVGEVVIVNVFDVCVSTAVEMHEVSSSVINFLHGS